MIGIHFGCLDKLKNFSPPYGFRLADGGKVLVFVAEKDDLAEVPIGVGLNCRYPVQDSTLKIELHHDADGLGKAGVHRDREIQGAHGPSFYKPAKRR